MAEMNSLIESGNLENHSDPSPLPHPKRTSYASAPPVLSTTNGLGRESDRREDKRAQEGEPSCFVRQISRRKGQKKG